MLSSEATLTLDDVVELPDSLANECCFAPYVTQFMFGVSHHVRFPWLGQLEQRIQIVAVFDFGFTNKLFGHPAGFGGL
jgi:hypothetical protein